jgi:hypothetical protein
LEEQQLRDVVVGAGGSTQWDPLEPAVDLAQSGLLDYLVFHCLSERTLALSQLRKLADPNTGHDERLPAICDTFAPYMAQGLRLVGAFGVVNVDRAAEIALTQLRKAGLEGHKVGVVRGDDVLDTVIAENSELTTLGMRVGDLGDKLISAHAYIGAEPIVESLAAGANLVLGGRFTDAALYLGPIAFEKGWGPSDWNELALGFLVGHFLEGARYCIGGNFADPPYREVPRMHEIPYPYAVVGDDSFELRKLPGTGGLNNRHTAKSHLVYEIHDPTKYFSPDVTADISNVIVEEIAEDAVRLSGATATGRPDDLRVAVGLDYGWKSVVEGSFGGPGCVTRAQTTADAIRNRLDRYSYDFLDTHYNLHGVNGLFGDQLKSDSDPVEVRLRVAIRCNTRDVAELINLECEQGIMNWGACGGGGRTRTVTPVIGITSAFLPRSKINITSEVITI